VLRRSSEVGAGRLLRSSPRPRWSEPPEPLRRGRTRHLYGRISPVPRTCPHTRMLRRIRPAGSRRPSVLAVEMMIRAARRQIVVPPPRALHAPAAMPVHNALPVLVQLPTRIRRPCRREQALGVPFQVRVGAHGPGRMHLFQFRRMRVCVNLHNLLPLRRGEIHLRVVEVGLPVRATVAHGLGDGLHALLSRVWTFQPTHDCWTQNLKQNQKKPNTRKSLEVLKSLQPSPFTRSQTPSSGLQCQHPQHSS
jgi:hypothetical protein